jgi:hypothetical protein
VRQPVHYKKLKLETGDLKPENLNPRIPPISTNCMGGVSRKGAKGAKIHSGIFNHGWTRANTDFLPRNTPNTRTGFSRKDAENAEVF